MKSILFVALATLLFRCDPVANLSREERIQLYNDALDQIISQNYFHHCLNFDETIEAIRRDFNRGKIDLLTYERIGDSLMLARKTMIPKCVLDYADQFQIHANDPGLDDDTKSSISQALNDTFFNSFAGVSVRSIVDTLAQTAQLNVSDLTIKYLDIVPYAKRPNRPFGHGMGVLAFSRTYFNKTADKAILYYEFSCGPKCGSGEIVFLKRTPSKWKIVGYKRIWDS